MKCKNILPTKCFIKWMNIEKKNCINLITNSVHIVDIFIVIFFVQQNPVDGIVILFDTALSAGPFSFSITDENLLDSGFALLARHVVAFFLHVPRDALPNEFRFRRILQLLLDLIVRPHRNQQRRALVGPFELLLTRVAHRAIIPTTSPHAWSCFSHRQTVSNEHSRNERGRMLATLSSPLRSNLQPTV